MATQRPISTISYNTEDFLVEKLDSWVSAKWIQAYMYICHKGEDGDKDHIHLYIEPNRRLDKMDLTNALVQYQNGSNKPLGVRPWRDSKEEDWILYVVHDKDYLKQKYANGDKGEKIPYSWQDIKTTNLFDVETCFIRAKQRLEHTSSNLTKQLQCGKSAVDLMAEGENPYIIRNVLGVLQKSDYEKLAYQAHTLDFKLSRLSEVLEGLSMCVTWISDKLVITDLQTGEIIHSDLEEESD